jgi:UDP-N-acetylmuramate--alanine ligase
VVWVHCVGIGGIGISAIARVLLEQGYRVTGSDLRRSPVAEALVGLGATVYVGHEASHIGQADMVLVSSAVPATNAELVEARRRAIPVLRRAEFLGKLMEGKIGIAVAGTHGKTTTTSMIAWILAQAGLDPTFIVGGVIRSLHTNARAGQGPHLVIEADEYDRMFLGLAPTVGVVTHLEHDHPDCFPSFTDMQVAFRQFLSLVSADGLIVGCADQPEVAALMRGPFQAPVQTCGLEAGNEWRAEGVALNSLGGYDFQVLHGGSEIGCVRLQVPGIHNVRNALIAVAVACWLGIGEQAIRDALVCFPGVERRFETIGQAGGITIVDDYAHHPTEIRATLAAARGRFGQRPLWVVFQPHTYSRLRALWDEFVTCFEQADHVVVLDVYAARETDTLGISAAGLVAQMTHPDVRYSAEIESAADYVACHAEPNAVVITCSAGDGNRVGTRVLDKLGG